MQPLASRLLLAVSAVAATGATALAQPSATMPVDPAAAPAPAPVAAPAPAPEPAADAAIPVVVAPQNTDWTQVSHINGQLVPVGEKNEYFYQYKRTIISADPIAWILGFYGVSASYGIDDHLALRAELDYIAPADSHQHWFEGDIGLPIYFRRTYQGAFLEPGLVVRQVVADDDVNYSSSPDGYPPPSRKAAQWGPQVLVGWHWTWDSGLNIAIAAGVGRNLGYKEGDGGDDRYIANGYMRFGYAF
jgi:hypothetical protein